MDGRKQATERGLSPEAAKAHVESVKRGTMDRLEEGGTHQTKPSLKPQAALNPQAVASDVAGKLSPATAAHARQAAAITGFQPTESSAGEAKVPPSSAAASRSAEARTV